MRGTMGRLIEFLHGRIKPRSDVDALHIAAFEGDLEHIKTAVIDNEIDVDAKLSTVMGASINQAPLFLAIQEGNIAAAKLLIELGAKIDSLNDMNVSPLMSACSSGDLKLVSFFIDLGASPNFFRNSDGASPLSFTLHIENDDIASKITTVLIKAGADVELPRGRSQSVLMLAARENLPKVIELLLNAGADPERQCSLKWAPDWTALDHAINERSNKAVEILSAITKTPPKVTS